MGKLKKMILEKKKASIQDIEEILSQIRSINDHGDFLKRSNAILKCRNSMKTNLRAFLNPEINDFKSFHFVLSKFFAGDLNKAIIYLPKLFIQGHFIEGTFLKECLNTFIFCSPKYRHLLGLMKIQDIQIELAKRIFMSKNTITGKNNNLFLQDFYKKTSDLVKSS